MLAQQAGFVVGIPTVQQRRSQTSPCQHILAEVIWIIANHFVTSIAEIRYGGSYTDPHDPTDFRGSYMQSAKILIILTSVESSFKKESWFLSRVLLARARLAAGYGSHTKSGRIHFPSEDHCIELIEPSLKCLHSR